jgi:hypothetical protein
MFDKSATAPVKATQIQKVDAEDIESRRCFFFKGLSKGQTERTSRQDRQFVHSNQTFWILQSNIKVSKEICDPNPSKLTISGMLLLFVSTVS